MPKFMLKLFDALLFPCKEVTQLVSESLDRDLPALQRVRLRLHFVMCLLCRRYHNQIVFIHDALHRHPDRLAEQGAGTTAGLSPQSRERIKRALTS